MPPSQLIAPCPGAAVGNAEVDAGIEQGSARVGAGPFQSDDDEPRGVVNSAFSLPPPSIANVPGPPIAERISVEVELKSVSVPNKVMGPSR